MEAIPQRKNRTDNKIDIQRNIILSLLGNVVTTPFICELSRLYEMEATKRPSYVCLRAVQSLRLHRPFTPLVG